MAHVVRPCVWYSVYPKTFSYRSRQRCQIYNGGFGRALDEPFNGALWFRWVWFGFSLNSPESHPPMYFKFNCKLCVSVVKDVTFEILLLFSNGDFSWSLLIFGLSTWCLSLEGYILNHRQKFDKWTLPESAKINGEVNIIFNLSRTWPIGRLSIPRPLKPTVRSL